METIEQRSERVSMWAYVAPDTIDVIERRVRNMLTGRRFSLVRFLGDSMQMGGISSDFLTSLYLDTEAYEGKGKGIRVERRDDPADASLLILAKPGISGCGMSGHFEDEVAAQRADQSSDYHDDSPTRVEIHGGYSDDPRAHGPNDYIEATWKNRYGVTHRWVIKPEYVNFAQRAEDDAKVLEVLGKNEDTLAQHSPTDLAALCRKWREPLSGVAKMLERGDI